MFYDHIARSRRAPTSVAPHTSVANFTKWKRSIQLMLLHTFLKSPPPPKTSICPITNRTNET